MGFRFATSAALFAAVSLAQSPQADGEQLLKDLDAMATQIEQLRENLKSLAKLARSTEGAAKAAGAEQTAAIAAGVQIELSKLATTAAQCGPALRLLHQRAAVVTPAEFLLPFAVDRLQAAAAAKLPLGDDAKALEQLEARLAKASGEGAEVALAVTRYHLAEAWLRRAGAEFERDPASVEVGRLQRRASARLRLVAEAPDCANSGAGTSLRATALWRVVQIESGLQIAFAEAARGPGGEVHLLTAEVHQQLATDAFQKLERNHSKDSLANGGSALDEARKSLARMK